VEAVINAALNTFMVNVDLFGWGIGSLFFVLLYLFLGKPNGSDVILIVLITSIVVAYSLFWFSGGPDFGARYWFVLIFPLVILTAKGINRLLERLRNHSSQNRFESGRIYAALIALCLVTVTIYLPWRAFDKYHHYLNMSPEVKQLSESNKWMNALVFILGNSHPDYASAWIFNPLQPDDQVPVYASAEDSNLTSDVLHAYPDRQVWVIAGPTVTKSGYKIIGGPFTNAEAVEYFSAGK
jgi:hypothetical protein